MSTISTKMSLNLSITRLPGALPQPFLIYHIVLGCILTNPKSKSKDFGCLYSQFLQPPTHPPHILHNHHRTSSDSGQARVKEGPEGSRRAEEGNRGSGPMTNKPMVSNGYRVFRKVWKGMVQCRLSFSPWIWGSWISQEI